ncbi:MAG: prolyl oligopeptidase family serine peptidase, partial [Chloroflexota bacterium]
MRGQAPRSADARSPRSEAELRDAIRPRIPYGSWRSPFPIELLVAGRVGLRESRFDTDGKSLVWLESRPEEDGRQVLVRWTPDAKGGGTARDISPAGMNVRDRVHEYGGASYLVAGDLVLVSDFATGRLHRVVADRTSEPITPEGAFRYADYELDEPRGRVIAVREDHSGSGEAVNTLVSIPLDGSGGVKVLTGGRTFYSSPRQSPDGGKLAFLAWDHPNLPWDGTELFVAPVAADGSLGRPERVAGSAADWIAQPVWSPSGVLHFVAEPNGWMNLYRLSERGLEPVTRLEAEFAFPDWVFGLRNYAFAPDGTILAIGRSDGADRLYRIPPNGSAVPLDLPFTEILDVDVAGERVVFGGAGPRSFNAIMLLDLAKGSPATIRLSSTADVEPDEIAVPEPIEFPTTGGLTAHGLFYRPTNSAFEGPAGERPPLIVTSHGGPTAQAFGALYIETQMFTSRGFAVLDVDYGGSTGYGKEYRKRLEGEWGVVDVDDCVNGARWLAERGDVDGERLSIRGGSASGYTTLSALAFRDAFAAGVSYFGIGDLLAFAKETHKFESRYLDRLLGPLPEATEIYRQRSPNNFAGQITAAVLIL